MSEETMQSDLQYSGHRSARVKNPCHKGAAVLFALLTCSSLGWAQGRLEVFPNNIHLNSSRAEQSIVCRVIDSNGVTHDVTSQVEWKLPGGAGVRMDGNVARPVGDGEWQMSVRYQDQEAPLHFSVKDAKVDRPISFKLDVMPVFMRAGCNVGSCHGSARGKDGFRLSLFGFDPDGDHYRLTREINGRRINLAIPAEGLLMEKASGKVPHTGGQRIKDGDEYWQTLIRWQEAGVPNDPPDIP